MNFSVAYILFAVDGGNSADDQNQTISCSLHLDPVDSVVEEQAGACICYDQTECGNECELGTDNCADAATCTDTASSFECSCNDGYTGDGVTCNEKFVVWLAYDRADWIANGYVDNGHLDQDGSWTDIRGSLNQVEVGEFGTFGINGNNRLYYKLGTHEDPYSAGPVTGTGNCGNDCRTEWQGLGNDYQYVSSGRDTAIILKGTPGTNMKLYSMENVSVDASGHLQYELLELDGGLKNVSVFRGIAWGVNGSNHIWRGDMALARSAESRPYSWTRVDNEHTITQIEIGEFGVFGLTDNGSIYYRIGTHQNIESLGTSWQLIPGGLTHISSGINRVYGVNANNQLFKMKSTNSFNDQGEMTWQDNNPWESITSRTGSNVSVL